MRWQTYDESKFKTQTKYIVGAEKSCEKKQEEIRLKKHEHVA